MEIQKVREQLTKVALDHSQKDPSAELQALRAISIALLHMAEAIEDLQRRSPRPSEYL